MQIRQFCDTLCFSVWLTTTSPMRSMYTLTRSEILRGVANRFVHSRTYIFFYLGMAALSVTTVVLSLTDGCPGLPFYILEIIINTAMILEVGIRFLALGRVSGHAISKTTLTPPSAILEITIQCCRLDPDGILCHHATSSRVCPMWSGKQRRRSPGYIDVGRTQRVAIWEVGFCNATVSVHACYRFGQLTITRDPDSRFFPNQSPLISTQQGEAGLALMSVWTVRKMTWSSSRLYESRWCLTRRPWQGTRSRERCRERHRHFWSEIRRTFGRRLDDGRDAAGAGSFLSLGVGLRQMMALSVPL